MLIVIALFERSNFEKNMVSNLKSYLEQQDRLKDIVREEDKLIHGDIDAGKLGQAVYT